MKIVGKFGWCQQGRECDYCVSPSASGMECGCTCHMTDTAPGPRKIKTTQFVGTDLSQYDDLEDADDQAVDEPSVAA